MGPKKPQNSRQISAQKIEKFTDELLQERREKECDCFAAVTCHDFESREGAVGLHRDLHSDQPLSL